MTAESDTTGHDRVASFCDDLKTLDSRQIFRKHLLDGAPFALDKNTSFVLRGAICDHFEIEFSDVVVVGSGKLGFSIKPTRRYGLFNDNSDIDVAVVSTHLFERIWKEASLYAKSGADWPNKNKFFNYLSAKGWVRPDKLPPSEYFDFSRLWIQFFNYDLARMNLCPFKVNAGIYHSWFFLEEYQKVCIEQCIRESKHEDVCNK